MELTKFIESHDKAMTAKNMILEIIRDGNERLGQELIDSEEVKQELQNVFDHIALLEKAITIEKG
ncbi:TPA: hypothetical protein U1C15_000462 [Streptococcus suis]|nr:hypothetical protein [Streptococcus suis]